MKEDTLIVKPRKPLDAAGLSALLPGLGQIYCGDIRRGILWMGASFALLIAAVATLMMAPTRSGFAFAVGLIAVDVILCLICAIHAWRLAKRVGREYPLKDYNRWYVYTVLLLIGICGSGLGLAFVLHERVVQAFVIPSKSMEPTIQHGDRIVTLKEVFLDRDPERGELVVFRNPEQRRQHYVKRVIAIAGDEVEWRENGEILVNGELLEQTPTEKEDEWVEENGGRDYTIRLTPDAVGGRTSGKLFVPDHQCFVLGDNRFVSRDSRYFGPIAYTALTARPVATVWGGLGALE